MRNIFIYLIMFLTTINCLSQNKDSIFFFYKKDFLKVKVNYEGYYHYSFKKEKFVTSSFGGSFEEKNNYFIGNDKIKNKTLKCKKIYNLKTYLENHKNELISKTTKKYDSYKLMQHFNKFNIFIKEKKYFIRVVYITTLSE